MDQAFDTQNLLPHLDIISSAERNVSSSFVLEISTGHLCLTRTVFEFKNSILSRTDHDLVVLINVVTVERPKAHLRQAAIGLFIYRSEGGGPDMNSARHLKTNYIISKYKDKITLEQIEDIKSGLFCEHHNSVEEWLGSWLHGRYKTTCNM